MGFEVGFLDRLGGLIVEVAGFRCAVVDRFARSILLLLTCLQFSILLLQLCFVNEVLLDLLD
jgi:hypothetical protein